MVSSQYTQKQRQKRFIPMLHGKEPYDLHTDCLVPSCRETFKNLSLLPSQFRPGLNKLTTVSHHFLYSELRSLIDIIK